VDSLWLASSEARIWSPIARKFPRLILRYFSGQETRSATISFIGVTLRLRRVLVDQRGARPQHDEMRDAESQRRSRENIGREVGLQR